MTMPARFNIRVLVHFVAIFGAELKTMSIINNLDIKYSNTRDM
jgi:hypothetical protein